MCVRHFADDTIFECGRDLTFIFSLSDVTAVSTDDEEEDDQDEPSAQPRTTRASRPLNPVDISSDSSSGTEILSYIELDDDE